ncbi:MAG TPA: hypothetical protein VN668_21105 [Stellaceae bacterium]|nr:hypothetical protein [Stellaceae bacterium]
MAAKSRTRLAPGEIALIERLVEAGALVAVPAFGSAKPHRVMTAALDPAGDRILLYLSTKPTLLEDAAATSNTKSKSRRRAGKRAARKKTA